jgi:hypothetical protein
MTASGTPKANRLLAALPNAAYRRLLPDLEATTLRVGETLFRPAGRLQFAYFPTTSGVTLSYALAGRGKMAKAWPVGREGVVGIPLFLGNAKRHNRADVEFGGLAFRLPASSLLAEFKRAGALQQMLLRYVFALVTQASQLRVCGHYHSLEQRLCCFLSRVFHRIATDELVITHHRIAEFMGVRRATITEAAGQLQAAGIIEYARGRVTLVNPQKLDKRACACNAIIKSVFTSVTE